MNLFDLLKKHHRYVDLESLRALELEKCQQWQLPAGQKYLEALEKVPEGLCQNFTLEHDVVQFGFPVDTETLNLIEQGAKELMPWRKGPFNISDLQIDAEWRSDLKWQRIKEHLPTLKDKRVLDIGCNNGYFLYQMLGHDPEFLLGIDPVLHFAAQFKFLEKFYADPRMHFKLWGVEHVMHFQQFFDVIFSMGIIYHHRHPIKQLLEIKQALRPGGSLIIETIGIPGEDPVALFPEDRYAKMRNVWFVPTLSCFINWVHKAKFEQIEVISDTPLTEEEQRVTKWSSEQSLKDFLDPEDKNKTIEGHPAPRRFCLKAVKKGRIK